MRKILSILLLFVLLVQAVPVLQMFSVEKQALFTCMDEEKLEKNLKAKDEGKEYFPANTNFSEIAASETRFAQYSHLRYTSPYLEFATPPPDAF